MYSFHQIILSEKGMLGKTSRVGPSGKTTVLPLFPINSEFVWGLRGEWRVELSSCEITDELSRVICGSSTELDL